jgi:hypothetical protein
MLYIVAIRGLPKVATSNPDTAANSGNVRLH